MRLIDADALLDKTVKKNSAWNSITNSEGKNLEEILSELPSVNPQKPKTIQEKQAESEKYDKAFEDGYEHGYAQARFDYEQEPKTGHSEPFINKPCISQGVCHEDKVKVLDNIRAEIEKPLHDERCFDTADAKAQYIALNWCVEIIDKYKAESEIHCNCTDEEIAKSFIEDVEAIKDLLPQKRNDKE